MRLADPGDNGPARPRRQRQLLYFSQALHTHFHHSVLCVAVHPEQGVRHADFIVLVALCFQCSAKCGECRVAELLRGGFAYASRDTYQHRGKTVSIVGAHTYHGVQRVLHQHAAPGRHPLHRVLRHHGARACLHCLCSVVMPVCALAADAYKQASRPCGAVICNYRIHNRVAFHLPQPAA